MICPSCARDIEVADEELKNNHGSICDCPFCETVLIVKFNRLHEYNSNH